VARAPRIEYPGALYHVLARGNQRRDIFHDDADRTKYLAKLAAYKHRHGFALYAYVLMTNHVHLLIETRDVGLGKIIQGIHQSYTQSYNRRYQTVGHVFQGRYKAFLCARETYLLELVRYIHLNPVRAKLVADPADYRWSSHRSYLGMEAGSGVDVQPVLAQFAAQPSVARQRYREFVGAAQDSTARPEYYQRVLGDEAFKEDIERRRTPGPEGPASRARTPHQLLDLVARSAGLPRARILGPERSIAVVRARRLFVQACQHSAIPGKEVATFLGRDAGLISRMGRMDEAERAQIAELLGLKSRSQA
jgi:REP element-mobilizing transposase RayT